MENTGVKTLIWDGKTLKLIDQRKLPFSKKYVICRTHRDVAKAIREMVVRGAPAIGVAAGYGTALAALKFSGGSSSLFKKYMSGAVREISSARPTAVNLFWALERLKNLIDAEIESGAKPAIVVEKIVSEAEKIHRQDVETNRMLGENSLKIFSGKGNLKKTGLNLLTHCNAGALATAGFGTALGVIRSLNARGMVGKVLVDETRPYLQGARLTAWELEQEKISYAVITDNMAGYFMARGEVDMIVVGADRIAANGDTANKIGTFSLSVLAKYHSIPFYIAAPYSTVDFKTATGKEIEIEQRPPDEVRKVLTCRVIPDYMPVLNPSFDITPGQNITAILTEIGPVFPPFKVNLVKNRDGKMSGR
jgi:methylthioribose-1-phosphate isomerase